MKTYAKTRAVMWEITELLVLPVTMDCARAAWCSCAAHKRISVHSSKFSLSSVRIMIMSQLSFCMYGTCVLTWRMYNMTICIYMKCVVYKQALTWRKSAFRKLKIALARYHA